MRRQKERDVEAIDVLLRELNVISFLAFTQAYIFLPLSIAFVLWGRTSFLLWYSVPWTAFAIVYLYWRMKYFRVKCTHFSKSKQAREYWRALMLDSLRIILIGGLAFSTFSPFMVRGAGISLYFATFVVGVFLYSLLLLFAYITYWGVARSSR